MRLLELNELEFVTGGVDAGTIADAAAITGALAGGAGAGVAQWLGMNAARQAAAASFFGFTSAALMTSFLVGYAAGEWLNKNTNIQEWASEFTGQGDDGDS